MPKIMAQYPTIRKYGQYRVQILRGYTTYMLSVLGYWAIILATAGDPESCLGALGFEVDVVQVFS